MTNPWDSYSIRRHRQIESGIDISYDEILVHTIIKILPDIDINHSIELLDVGCSTGILITRIINPEWHIVGIDNSSESISIAKNVTQKYQNVDIINISLLDYYPQGNKTFDVIICNMVLHTIDDLLSSIAALNRLLKVDGILVVSIPHPCFWADYKNLQFSKRFRYTKPKKFLHDFYITNDPKPFPQKVPYNHRPLSTYINTLINYGFELKKVLEPFPDSKTMKKYNNSWKNPHFLFLIASKKKGD